MCFAGERRSDRTSTIRIAFYLFGSIAGFRPSLRWLRLSGRRPSFAGTVLGFGLIGQIWLQDDDDGEDYGPILLTEQATKLCRVGWTISGAVRKSGNRCVLVEAFQVYP